MIETLKECLDVQIDDPVGTPAPLTCGAHRIERRLAGSIGVRVVMEQWFHERLEHLLHDRLCHAIAHRRNAQWTHAAIPFWDLDEADRRGKVGSRRHPIPDLVEVALQICLERRQGLTIHAGRTSVCLHSLVGFPNE